MMMTNPDFGPSRHHTECGGDLD